MSCQFFLLLYKTELKWERREVDIDDKVYIDVAINVMVDKVGDIGIGNDYG